MKCKVYFVDGSNQIYDIRDDIISQLYDVSGETIKNGFFFHREQGWLFFFDKVIRWEKVVD